MIIKPKVGMWKGMSKGMGLSSVDKTVSVGGGIEQVGSATNSTSINSSVITLARSVGSGTNRILLVAIAWYSGPGTGIVSSVVFNTTETLTEIIQDTGYYGTMGSALYVLVNPTNTTANVVVTFSGTITGVISITEWNGVDQTTPTHDAISADGESTTPTVNVANVLLGEVTIDASHIYGNPTPGAGQSQQMEVAITGSYYGTSSTDTTSTGTVTQSYTASSSAWVMCACALVGA